MTDVTEIKCTPRTLLKVLPDIYMAGLVPYIEGAPGIGKSAIARTFCKQANLTQIDTRLSTAEPTDLTGVLRVTDESAYFVPIEEMFPVDTTPIPTGSNGWLVLLDEYAQAPKQVQNASFKVILDKMVGYRKLHPNAFLMLCSNPQSSKTFTTEPNPAMRSRLVNLSLTTNFSEWCEDVAFVEGYDSRIITYLSQYPEHLLTFDPNSKEKTFACSRTWEFANKLLKTIDLSDHTTALMLLGGTLSYGVASSFLSFCELYNEIQNIEDIIKHPDVVPVPTLPSHRWIIASMLIQQVNDENLANIIQYINKNDIAIRIMFYRWLVFKQPMILNNPIYIAGTSTIHEYLKG